MPTVLDELSRRYPTAKRQTLRRMIGAHRVLLNGTAVRSAKQAVAAKDRLEVIEPTARRPAAPVRMPLAVVYEDDDVIVIDKPPGLLSSSVPREKRATALGILREHVSLAGARGGRIGLVHRLDRDASGLLLFSKNDLAHRALKRQFREHSVRRIYTAAVVAMPPHLTGKMTSRLVELPDGSVRSTPAPRAGELAITHYEVLGKRGALVILRLTLHTGRKHQIRAQLSELGTPIAGDAVYGVKQGRRRGASDDAGRLMLMATELAFDHPRDGRRVELKLAVPEEMTPE